MSSKKNKSEPKGFLVSGSYSGRINNLIFQKNGYIRIYVIRLKRKNHG